MFLIEKSTKYLFGVQYLLCFLSLTGSQSILIHIFILSGSNNREPEQKTSREPSEDMCVVECRDVPLSMVCCCLAVQMSRLMPSITWLFDSTSLSLLFFGRNMTGREETAEMHAVSKWGIQNLSGLWGLNGILAFLAQRSRSHCVRLHLIRSQPFLWKSIYMIIPHISPMTHLENLFILMTGELMKTF